MLEDYASSEGDGNEAGDLDAGNALPASPVEIPLSPDDVDLPGEWELGRGDEITGIAGVGAQPPVPHTLRQLTLPR